MAVTVKQMSRVGWFLEMDGEMLLALIWTEGSIFRVVQISILTATVKGELDSVDRSLESIKVREIIRGCLVSTRDGSFSTSKVCSAEGLIHRQTNRIESLKSHLFIRAHASIYLHITLAC